MLMFLTRAFTILRFYIFSILAHMYAPGYPITTSYTDHCLIVCFVLFFVCLAPQILFASSSTERPETCRREEHRRSRPSHGAGRCH
jgi:hypothetical protein